MLKRALSTGGLIKGCGYCAVLDHGIVKARKYGISVQNIQHNGGEGEIGRQTQSLRNMYPCHRRRALYQYICVLALFPGIEEHYIAISTSTPTKHTENPIIKQLTLVDPRPELLHFQSAMARPKQQELHEKKGGPTCVILSLKNCGENILCSTLNFINAPGSPPAVRCLIPHPSTHALYSPCVTIVTVCPAPLRPSPSAMYGWTSPLEPMVRTVKRRWGIPYEIWRGMFMGFAR